MIKLPASPEELIKDYGPTVYAIAYRVTLRHDLAEEASAQALHSAWSRRERFDGRATFKTWVSSIALHAAIDRLRREQAQTPNQTLPLEAVAERAAEPAESSPALAAQRNEENERVRQALGRMNEVHRAVLVLREWEGLSYQEIARTMGCPIGTVMSRLAHARRLLRDILGEDDA